jgi:proteasome alpha subunit
MTTPFYVSPEQIMKDKADYARKGIARGRSVVVLTYTDGILFVAENPSKALHKISEIYDRIAFAAVGKYNEFEALRVAGVRLADMRGYSYDRRDVTGRGLANAYAQTLGAIFTEAGKPYEVEIVVAEVGDTPDQDQMYQLTYDGSVVEQHDFVAMGGSSEQVASVLRDKHRQAMPIADALSAAVAALAAQDSEPRTLTPTQLEVAVLDRTRPNRLFKRIVGDQLESLIGTAGAESASS